MTRIIPVGLPISARTLAARSGQRKLHVRWLMPGAVITGLDPVIHTVTVPFDQRCPGRGYGMDSMIKSWHDEVSVVSPATLSTSS